MSIGNEINNLIKKKGDIDKFYICFSANGGIKAGDLVLKKLQSSRETKYSCYWNSFIKLRTNYTNCISESEGIYTCRIDRHCTNISEEIEEYKYHLVYIYSGYYNVSALRRNIIYSISRVGKEPMYISILEVNPKQILRKEITKYFIEILPEIDIDYIYIKVKHKILNEKKIRTKELNSIS